MNRDVRAGKKLSVFVRASINGEIDEIRPNSTVVEQRVPLTRRAVADNSLSGPLRLDQELQKLAFGLAHARLEIVVVLERCNAGLSFASAEIDEPLGHLFLGVLRVARVDPD